MKITVYGGTNNKYYSEKEIQACADLGKFLAQHGFEILTGACGGYPYYIGRGAVQAGGKVIGYTPAKDLQEHLERYKFATDGVTDLEFNKNVLSTNSENFLKRSMDMTPYSDVVVALGGSWGTFSELLFSFFAKKKIIIVDEFKGAGEIFDIVDDFFRQRDNNPDVVNGAEIIHVPDLAALKKMLLQMVK
ncbi:MAG: LOG family protein [Clostridia bacterium]|nr:LOG family protein [Clostridia bacterium]